MIQVNVLFTGASRQHKPAPLGTDNLRKAEFHPNQITLSTNWNPADINAFVDDFRNQHED